MGGGGLLVLDGLSAGFSGLCVTMRVCDTVRR